MTAINWRSATTLEHLQQRATLLQQVRQFFAERDVLEVDTPLLCRAGVTDLHLDNVECQLASGPDGNPLPLQLQTSPEYAMKRLLAQFRCSIYQLSHVVRDDEIGRYHNPEFSLLEWYRVGFTSRQLIDEVSQLLQQVLAAPAIETTTYQQLFIRYLAADPLTEEGVNKVHQQLRERQDTAEWMAAETDADTILQVAFNLLIEPQLPHGIPIAVNQFPASQAALAKISEDDPRVAERFEVYYQGIELANGYHELTDARQQRQRFVEDNEKRCQQGKPQRPLDEKLLAAMEAGMPDCSGVALGFDRLLMLALGASHIKQVLPFSVDNC